jgi:hypothetical protein
MKRVNLFSSTNHRSNRPNRRNHNRLHTLLLNNQTDPYGWMSQMWGNHDNPNGHRGMMSQTSTPTPTTSSILPYYGILFAVLIATVIISIIGISYYLVYPQIRTSPALPPTTLNVPHTPQTAQTSNAYETLAKTLTEDERKVIAVLQAHNASTCRNTSKPRRD